jgi:hypothetical protein
VELDAELAVFEAMLDRWRTQQLARSLSFATIDVGSSSCSAPLEHTLEKPERTSHITTRVIGSDARRRGYWVPD